MSTACLDSRSVVRVTGADAGAFLQNLLTCDVEAVSPGKAAFGALLTPQGKILFDFFLHRIAAGHFLFDIDVSLTETFIKRLGLYRLRSKVDIESASDLRVIAGWNDTPLPDVVIAESPDPRLEALGWRAIVNAESTAMSETAYHTHRIALGVPQGGIDYAFNDTFPHEADMDQLHGASFTKGCYVGQEIVSRMQHRSTARTRCVAATFESPHAPISGAPIMVGAKAIGTVGSADSDKLIAMVRIDKVVDALAAGETITADGIKLFLGKPDWATFDFPAIGQ